MSAITIDTIDHVIADHQRVPPNATEIEMLAEVREAALALAKAILKNTVLCADQQAALRWVRTALTTANAAIVLRGAV